MGLNIKWVIPFAILLVTLMYSYKPPVEGLETITVGIGSEVPTGYYIVSTTDKTQTIAKIPQGYMLNPDKSPRAPAIVRILNRSVFAPKHRGVDISGALNPKDPRYDPATYNTLYHIDAQESEYETQEQSGMWIYDASGRKVLLPWPGVQNDITYYEPGSYPYGPGTYIPNYEDSVYMSQTTQMSTVTPIYNTTDMLGGFCKQLANDPEKLEQTCNSIDLDKCASTSCCVLFGGTKCVTGDESGPKTRANYSDIFVKNKDVYYYQGKCYGNC